MKIKGMKNIKLIEVDMVLTNYMVTTLEDQPGNRWREVWRRVE